MQKINEGILSRTADLFYAFKFLKLLTKPWTETKAFELGLIDNKGKVLKKAKTSDEKSAYTVFNRLVFNVKRLLPGNKIASYAAALFLIKEHTGIPESKLKSILEEATGETITDTHFNENKWFETDTGLNKGTYTLTEDAVSPVTGEVIALKGTKVNVQEKTTPCSTILGKSIYKVVHVPTKQEIYVSNGDIKR